MGSHFYLFVRYDLSPEQTVIQTNHATFEMAYTLPQSVDLTTPSLVLIGVPDKKALHRVMRKLRLHHIEFSAFYEPDNDLGLTAVATVPLDDEQRVVLQQYKLWTQEAFVSGQSVSRGEHDHSSGCLADASPDAALNQEFLHAPSSVVRAPLQFDGGPRFESLGAYQDARVA
jgi:hypothetical protein